MKVIFSLPDKPATLICYAEELKNDILPSGCRWRSPSRHAVVVRDVVTWQEAEDFFIHEIAENQDSFIDVVHLSKKSAIFPFDFQATSNWDEPEPRKFLVDVTLRTCKDVRTKCLSTWRAMGYTPAMFFVLPKLECSIFAEIEPDERTVRVTKKIIAEVKHDSWCDCQTKLKVDVG